MLARNDENAMRGLCAIFLTLFVLLACAKAPVLADGVAESIDLDKAIESEPKSSSFYNNRGLGWSFKGEFDKAITAFDEAIRLDPKSASAYLNRGVVWKDKGELDKAIADYDEAIRLHPRGSSAYNNRGIAWSDRGDFDKALADYDESIRLDPHWIPYSNRGNAWRSKGDLDRALADFDEAIRLNPKYARAYRNRGSARGQRGDLDQALADYDESIRLDPGSAWGRWGRGIILWLRRDAQALDAFDRAIAIDGWQSDAAPYAALYGHLAAHEIADGAKAESYLDLAAERSRDAWPRPLIEFLRSAVDEATMISRAKTAEERTDARYFAGRGRIGNGDVDAAREHWNWVAEHGDKAAVAYQLTVDELRRLDASEKASRP